MNLMFDSYAKAYEYSLRTVMEKPHFTASPRGKKINEVVNFSVGINNPLSNMFENEVRSVPTRYIAGELDWYFSGDNNIKGIIDYSKFWDFIKNEDGSLNSAYGHILFKKLNKHGKIQWNWAYESLVKDLDSRQAIMYFGGPDYQYDGNKDFVCTCFGQFLVRANMLHFIVTMRSNDLIRGMTFDIPFFLVLQQNMLLLLQKHYPGLKLGGYVHNAISAHVYEEHFDLANEMLAKPFVDSALPELEFPIVSETGEYIKESQPMYDWIQANK